MVNKFNKEKKNEWIKNKKKYFFKFYKILLLFHFKNLNKKNSEKKKINLT
jgi:hypothetical protein